jgi:putative ABC transport system ATP-binding protein
MINLLNIKKEFKFHSSKNVILDNINFKIAQGHFTSIIGRSGSGKTTLLKIIAGLIRPTSGKVVYENYENKRLSDRVISLFRKNYIGFVFQDFNIIPYYTTLENVIIPLKFTSIPNKDHIKKGLDLLNQFNIYEKRDYYPSSLSGGQMQRLAISRALINSPKLLIADEPTGNLDSKTSNEIMDVFIKLNHEHNMACLIVSHDSNIISQSKNKYLLENKALNQIA